jgi:hypothetical protein
VLVLTGTDLYRDIDHDAAAPSARWRWPTAGGAQRAGPRSLPEALRGQAAWCCSPARRASRCQDHTRHLRALMVGHLRDEKDPRPTGAPRAAWRPPDILLDHIGEALDPALGAQAPALAAAPARTTAGWARCRTRPRAGASRQAHVLVHPSRMEGGAHVVIEAMRSGTPVLASRIDGNLGLLGATTPATSTGVTTPRWPPCWSARATIPLCCRPAAPVRLRAPLFAPEPKRSPAAPAGGGLLRRPSRRPR